MRAVIIGIMGLLGSWGHAGAEPLLEGRVRLDSGQPVPGGQVLLFDLADLRAAPLAATTDGSGRFTLPLASLAGVLPERLELGANYPNPFNPSTMIPYQLPAAMHVRLEVFNSLGQRVATLVEGERPAGSHTASWDATDARGQAVAAGVYLCRLSADGVQATRSMLLIDGQAGTASGGPGGAAPAEGEAGAKAPVYGLTVSAPGLVPYVDPAFRVTAGMAPLDLVVAPGNVPTAKAASSGGILGDVDNTGGVDFFDALLVALYSQDSSITMPNNGDISLGDVNADGQVDLSDAWVIAAWLNDPADPALPAGIGEPVGAALASLSPDPSTVTFADDGAWHRFTVQAGESVTVVANPEGTTPRLEITTRSGRGNFCPAEAEDDVSRDHGQTLYLSGCASGQATVELRRASDGTVLRTYTLEVTGIPSDLVVESVSVSDSTLTPGQSFTLSATVRNQGTSRAEATTLGWYRSSNRTISTRDTQVGTDAVGALAAEGTGAESISLTAPSTEGTNYYGACVESVEGERGGNNCSAGIRVTVGGSSRDLVVQSTSVNDSILTTEQAFILRTTVQNQGTDESPEFVLSYYRSSSETLSTQDTQVGTDDVSSLAASSIRNESIRLTAPSTPGTYYYGACVASVSGGNDTPTNCSTGVSVIVEEEDGADRQDEDLVFIDPQIYNDNVFVLPVTENLAAGGLPLRDYAARFYEHFHDEFDFLIFISNVLEPEAGTLWPFASHIGVKNAVQGIGRDQYYDDRWGSAGKLQSVIRFQYFGVWSSPRLGMYTSLGTLIHELMHRWANSIISPYGHWGFINQKGWLGGADWLEVIDLGDGTFRIITPLIGPLPVYSPIELYLAGFIPPAGVPDVMIADHIMTDGKYISYDVPGVHGGVATARGFKTYTIEDIIAEHGPRVPDHTQAQKDFRAAVILLVSEEFPVDPVILGVVSDEVSYLASLSEDTYDGLKMNFFVATGGRGTITMDDLSHFRRRASAKRLVPSSSGVPPTAHRGSLGMTARTRTEGWRAIVGSSTRGLPLWGGRSESGELFLEPAFVVGVPPVPPRLDGPYRLKGEDEDGGSLFSLPFRNARARMRRPEQRLRLHSSRRGRLGGPAGARGAFRPRGRLDPGRRGRPFRRAPAGPAGTGPGGPAGLARGGRETGGRPPGAAGTGAGGADQPRTAGFGLVGALSAVLPG